MYLVLVKNNSSFSNNHLEEYSARFIECKFRVGALMKEYKEDCQVYHLGDLPIMISAEIELKSGKITEET